MKLNYIEEAHELFGVSLRNTLRLKASLAGDLQALVISFAEINLPANDSVGRVGVS